MEANALQLMKRLTSLPDLTAGSCMKRMPVGFDKASVQKTCLYRGLPLCGDVNTPLLDLQSPEQPCIPV